MAAKPKIVFFTGRDAPVKKYQHFLEKISCQIVDPENKIEDIDLIIAHSLGVIKALDYCVTFGLKPKKIISIDGTYLSYNVLRQLPDLPEVAKKYLDDRYAWPCPVELWRFLEMPFSPLNLNFRQARTLDDFKSPYEKIYLYSEGGHWPFENKSFRVKFLSALSNQV